MEKIRVSYSILNAFSHGDITGAINMYYKVFRPSNSAMEQGIEFHKTWQVYTDKYKKLHPNISTLNKALSDPRTELKLEVDITPIIQFVGVIDCLDEPFIYEYKSGSKPSSEYANGNQIDCYAVLLKYCNIKVEKGFYLHYDQIIKETDSAMIWITEDRLKKAEKWIIEQALAFKKYIEDNNLDETYKQEDTQLEIIEQTQ